MIIIIALFLNVINIFNTFFYERLLYKLKKRIFVNIIKYSASFVNDKNTKIKLFN